MTTLKTLLLVVVLGVAGYLLLPYVKTNPNLKPAPNNQNQNSDSNSNSNPSAGNITTYTSDSFGVKFDYAKDQDGDGKDDTAVAEAGDKIYVYYTASPKESGQWVQMFAKDPNVSLADAVKAKFLTGISDKDCYATDMNDFFAKLDAQVPPLPTNVQRVIIAYPFPTDQTQPFDANAAKCPKTYSLTNGISYFEMDKTHPDKFYFFSIGQYAIFANPDKQTAWQDTFTVTK